MKRCAGILLAVSSLPSNYGMGDFGDSSYQFIDILKNTGFKIWQILPLNPLGFGNSPYQPYSSKAIDELYISLEKLTEDGLLLNVPSFFNKTKDVVDYEAVREYKGQFLKLAFEAFNKLNEFEEFDQWIKDNAWVYNYAVFITFKKANNKKMWTEWIPEHKFWITSKEKNVSGYEEQIRYEMWIQFIAFSQWNKIHQYAKENDIQLMGDIPFYVGIDSIDVWENQNYFLLDEVGNASFIAGVPPDYFSKTGQRWGNPIYNWENLEKDGFKFWIDRIGFNINVFDILRIDHFRAFDTYWKVPSTCETAIEGEWVNAPGYKLFDKLYSVFPEIDIVAEDLGDLFDSVLVLRDHYNLPGMNILQFTFDIDKAEYGLKDRENQLVYTGTHDNETIVGWVQSLSNDQKNRLFNKLSSLGIYDKDPAQAFIKLAFINKANYAIIPLQDVLSLDNKARMNTPSTIGSPDWEWKLVNFDKFVELSDYLRNLITSSNR
ncbi:MAG: 4-alpha-glucanotransferase [Bacilli bacterium]